MTTKIDLTKLQNQIIGEMFKELANGKVLKRINQSDLENIFSLSKTALSVHDTKVIYILLITINQRRNAAWSKDFINTSSRAGFLRSIDTLESKLLNAIKSEILFLKVLPKFSTRYHKLHLPMECFFEINELFTVNIKELNNLIEKYSLSTASRPLDISKSNFKHGYYQPSLTGYSVSSELYVSKDYFWLEGTFDTGLANETVCFQTEKVSLEDMDFPDIELNQPVEVTLETRNKKWFEGKMHYVNHVLESESIYAEELNRLSALEVRFENEVHGVSRDKLPNFVADCGETLKFFQQQNMMKDRIIQETERVTELSRQLAISAANKLFNIRIDQVVCYYDGKGFMKRLKVKQVDLVDCSMLIGGLLLKKDGSLSSRYDTHSLPIKEKEPNTK